MLPALENHILCHFPYDCQPLQERQLRTVLDSVLAKSFIQNTSEKKKYLSVVIFYLGNTYVYAYIHTHYTHVQYNI